MLGSRKAADRRGANWPTSVLVNGGFRSFGWFDRFVYVDVGGTLQYQYRRGRGASVDSGVDASLAQGILAARAD
jgi:hypothetical protein